MERGRPSPGYAALLAERRAALATELEGVLRATTEFVWELGCGHGHFLTAYAKAHPEACCIGIDIASERIERAERKRERARLPNLHFLQAEARLFLTALPPAARIREAFVLFPDPWPKSRHHKHRILQPEFLDELEAHSTPECRMNFRTDFAAYFQSVRAILASHPKWQRVDEAWPFEAETVFQNRAAGHYSLVARRIL